MIESTRDATVRVVAEAFNTAHDPAPLDAPQLEKHRRHDSHQHHYACWLCTEDVEQLAPHIVEALADDGLLRTAITEPAQVVTAEQVTKLTEYLSANNESWQHVYPDEDYVRGALRAAGISVQDGEQP